jgi:hypothetical protein
VNNEFFVRFFTIFLELSASIQTRLGTEAKLCMFFFFNSIGLTALVRLRFGVPKII